MRETGGATSRGGLRPLALAIVLLAVPTSLVGLTPQFQFEVALLPLFGIGGWLLAGAVYEQVELKAPKFTDRFVGRFLSWWMGWGLMFAAMKLGWPDGGFGPDEPASWWVMQGVAVVSAVIAAAFLPKALR